jgi:modulator of FtsH protease
MEYNEKVISPTSTILSTNVVLRKTYMLLAATLLFSAITAGFAMFTNAPPLNPILTIVVYIGLLFLTNMLRNNPVAGVICVFALTGFLGYTLGPILSFYIHSFANGGQLVMTALGGTAVIFFALSGYALVSKTDFSYLGGFLMAAIMVAFLAGIAAMVFHMPMLDLVVSGAFMLLSSGMILFQTSLIIHGGETNYVMAALNIYISLLNIFLSLLRILSAFSNNRN